VDLAKGFDFEFEEASGYSEEEKKYLLAYITGRHERLRCLDPKPVWSKRTSEKRNHDRKTKDPEHGAVL
jgi:hypothetical protein